ncbi:hypothetical protein BHM03_00000981 [Ensete ventricosum]|nr:hypothetical protein BHM03_00000981 [Ensete ventricosum]
MEHTQQEKKKREIEGENRVGRGRRRATFTFPMRAFFVLRWGHSSACDLYSLSVHRTVNAAVNSAAALCVRVTKYEWGIYSTLADSNISSDAIRD